MITLITTGGTIDKVYAAQAGTSDLSIGDPAVRDILARVNPAIEIAISEATRTDSLDMTDADRAVILEACENAAAERIIITHGTDTMVKTAGVLSQVSGKTIVLTGSARPAIFRDTDADFNLGVAFGAVQALPHGVYIAMNGRLRDWRDTVKDKATGQFQSVG